MGVHLLPQRLRSNFDGTLSIRNCVWEPLEDGRTQYPLLHALNSGDHDFGYPCALPHTIQVEGLMIDDTKLDGNRT